MIAESNRIDDIYTYASDDDDARNGDPRWKQFTYLVGYLGPFMTWQDFKHRQKEPEQYAYEEERQLVNPRTAPWYRWYKDMISLSGRIMSFTEFYDMFDKHDRWDEFLSSGENKESEELPPLEDPTPKGSDSVFRWELFTLPEENEYGDM